MIGTNLFESNQYGLNHIWQLMETQSNEIDIKENTMMKNFRNFINSSGIDLKSSLLLIFDVLMQLIEVNINTECFWMNDTNENYRYVHKKAI